jgi:hypothetical protein
LIEELAPKAELAAANHYIDLLRQGQLFDIEADIDPSIRTEHIYGALARMAAAVPAGSPVSRKLVGSNTVVSPGATTANFTFEYEFPGRWLLINIAIQEKGGRHTILGFRVSRIQDSVEHMNRFTLAGKGPGYYLVLGLVLAAPLLSIFSLIACIRTKVRRLKWLWILFILFGFGIYSLNWTTGQTSYGILSFQLLSASAFRQLFGPWTLSVSLPVGAIVFLVVRGRLAKPIASPEQSGGQGAQV